MAHEKDEASSEEASKDYDQEKQEESIDIGQDHGEQETSNGPNNGKHEESSGHGPNNGKHEESSGHGPNNGKHEASSGHGEDSGEVQEDEQPPSRPRRPVNVGGRWYYINIPIRPLSGHVRDDHVQSLKSYFPFYGIVFAVIGAVAIVVPRFFGLPIPDVLAWSLVVAGSFSLLQFILICGAPGTFVTLLFGALHLAMGFWLLLQPVAGTTALTFIVSLWFLAHGVVKIFMSISVRKFTTWPAVLVSAFASFILAFAVLGLTPTVGSKLIAAAFGVDMVLTGIAFLLISLMACLGTADRSVSDADAVLDPLLGGHRRANAEGLV